MKVAYLISAKGHGRGGHFYSLRATVEALAKEIDPLVINCGPSRSPVIEESKFAVANVPYVGQRLEEHCRAITEAVERSEAKLLHAFDPESLYFARIAAQSLKLPLIFTKCGGPNPGWYYPWVGNLVVYSMENRRFFADRYTRRGGRVLYIPNRASRPCPDVARIAELKARLKPNSSIILRICRIAAYYRPSLLQGARLVARLNRDGIAAQLLLIGAVQDAELIDEVSRESEGNAVVVCESRFTTSAAQLIDIADVVVGTGRGFMEAALSGKPIAVPVNGCPVPVLARRERIERLFECNFSQRATLPDVSQASAYEEIKELCASDRVRGDVAASTKEFADANFDVAASVPRYLDLYRSVRFCREWAPVDRFLHRRLTQRSFDAALENLRRETATLGATSELGQSKDVANG